MLLQPARAVLMNSGIHDKCGHMVEPAGQARGASSVQHAHTSSYLSLFTPWLKKKSHQTAQLETAAGRG